MKLSRKHQAFIEEYLKDYNGQKAAVRAGYSEKYARVTAYRILQNPVAQAVIEKRLEDMKMSANEVLRGIATKARDATSESVQLRAYEKLADIHGLTKDRIEGELTFRVIYGDKDSPEETAS